MPSAWRHAFMPIARADQALDLGDLGIRVSDQGGLGFRVSDLGNLGFRVRVPDVGDLGCRFVCWSS